MNDLDLSIWLESAADAGAMIALLLLLTLLYAAEAALLAHPRERVRAALESDERGARLLLFWTDMPQATWLSGIVWQCGVWIALWALMVRLASENPGRWNLLQVLAAMALSWLALVCLRWLGQLLGRSFDTTMARTAMVLLAPTAALLSSPLRWSSRLAHAVGLSGPDSAMWMPGPAAGQPPLAAGPFWTADTLAEVTHAAHRYGAERDVDLFASLATFSGTVIREVMVPRTEMLSIPLDAPEPEVLRLVLEAQHSRMPVYDDTIDHIVGLLHVKALMEQQHKKEPFVLAMLLRPTFYVPEVMKISALLQEFQRRKTHMAIVVDEYGGTSGIVTLEDIIEEIVGEIHDEYDVEEKQLRILPDGKIIADAKVSIDDVEEALQASFSTHGEYESLGGFLVALSGNMPLRGAVFHVGDVTFTIKDANERRIITVDIERRPHFKK